MRGLVAVAFGVLAIVLVPLTLVTIFTIFAIWLILDGIVSVAIGVREAQRRHRWGGLVFGGLAAIAAGLIVFIWPGLTAKALLFVVAIWALVNGVVRLGEYTASARRRHRVGSAWTLGVAGLASLVLGVLLLANPMAGAVALAWLIGIFALIYGAMVLVQAFREAPHGHRRAIV